MTGANHEERWVGQVLDFWFDELNRQDWFLKNSAVDDEITTRFGDLVDEISQSQMDEHLLSGRRALAAVITLDQFPRNIHRGTAKSFAYDRIALEISDKAIMAKHDQTLETDQRLFLYLPFEHSEDEADQARAVSLITALGNEQYTQYAKAHKDVIDRFGRFPHRNAILGRVSTAEEEAYLAEADSGF